jgi:opacity protein-like surface antigen
LTGESYSPFGAYFSFSYNVADNVRLEFVDFYNTMTTKYDDNEITSHVNVIGVNCHYLFPMDNGSNWYVGGGLGFAKENGEYKLAHQTTKTKTKTDWELAINLAGGYNLQLSHNWYLDFGLRYHIIGELDLSLFSIRAGVSYRF